MADVKWIKLDVGIFEDEKIRIILSMPEGKSMLIIWLKLLCLAGRINNSGVLMVNRTIPYTVEMLASVFNEPEPIMRITIDTFSKLDMIEQFNGTLLLPNWEKHQSEDKLKEIQRKSAERVSRHRANQRLVTGGNVTETLHVTLPKRICNADVTQSLSKNKNLEQELRTKNTESSNDVADKPQKPAPKKFVPPTIEEVQEYCKKRNKGIDAETFWHYYNSNGWMRNKTAIKDWKSAVITWERNSFDKKTQTNDGYNANWVELPKERA